MDSVKNGPSICPVISLYLPQFMGVIPARRRRQPLNKIKVLYYLRAETKDTEGYMSLRGIARFHGTRFNFSPAERVMQKHLVGTGRNQREVKLWEPKACRVLPDHPRAREINKELQRWEDDIIEAFEKLSAPSGHTQVTREMMENAIFPEPTVTEPAVTAPEQLTFAEHNEAWKQENAGVLAANTLRKYNQVILKLEEFLPNT